MAIYSPRSISADVETIFAMQDCYVDTLSDARTVAADQLVFRLNTFELDRESFKLEQERALGLITAERLSDDYLKELVFAPMEAAVALAQSDLEAATAELTQIQEE